MIKLIMGTTFKEIYCMTNIMSDNNKYNVMTTDKFYAYMYQLLKFSIGQFEIYSYTPLTMLTNYSNYTFSYIADGEDNTLTIPLSEKVEDTSIYTKENLQKGVFNIYIGYRANDEESYIEIKDYIYDDTDIDNPKIILPAIPKCNTDIYVAFYTVGEFENTLNMKEINILSMGCLVPYLCEKMIKDSLLNQKIYSNTVNSFSQANQIDAINKVYDSVYFKTLKSEINKYTYSYSPNDLNDLGGGTGYTGGDY